MKALYIGSFDPFTNGHYEILKQAEKLFDEVIICIATNPNKKLYFERYITIDCIKSVIGENTKLIHSDSLATDIAKYYDCEYIVRGLRNTSDYLYEENLYQMYKQLNPDIKVLYLRAENNVSSTLVRELFKREMDVSQYIPYSPDMLLSEYEKMLKTLPKD